MAWPGRGAVSRYKICIVSETGLVGLACHDTVKCIVTRDKTEAVGG